MLTGLFQVGALCQRDCELALFDLPWLSFLPLIKKKTTIIIHMEIWLCGIWKSLKTLPTCSELISKEAFGISLFWSSGDKSKCYHVSLAKPMSYNKKLIKYCCLMEPQGSTVFILTVSAVSWISSTCTPPTTWSINRVNRESRLIHSQTPQHCL